MVGAVSPSEVPPELVLRFLRDQIAAHRDRSPKLREGALTFAIVRGDGLTDFWTIWIKPGDVALENGVAPIQYKGPTAVLYCDDASLEAITREGVIDGVEAEGDAAFLRAIAVCFGDPVDPIRLRTGK